MLRARNDDADGDVTELCEENITPKQPISENGDIVRQYI